MKIAGAGRRWLSMGLVLAALCPTVRSAAREPAQDFRRSPCNFEALDNDVLVTHCDSFPVHFWGGMPGELSVIGGFSPGLLDPGLFRTRARSLLDRTSPQKKDLVDNPARDSLLIVIDAGHGGGQFGAIGPTGVREKDIVLAVAEQARRVFDGLEDVEVVMTRLKDEEISLFDRVEAANQLGADLFISIHANAFTSPHLGGVETFFHSIEASDAEAQRVASAENAPAGRQPLAAKDALSYILQDMHGAEKLRDSSRLAHLVQDQLARAVPFENRGVMQADFIVLRDTRMPSVLIELGFLTNPKEEKILQEPEIHTEIAVAVRRGVLQFWELIKRKQVRPQREKRSRP